jgi:predicted HTH transcriptional regulator
MELNMSQRAEIAIELGKFANDLNLSEGQKEKLRAVLTEGRERLEQFRQENPNVTREQIAQKIATSRSSIRERLVSFLTAEQLSKWDAAMAKAKDFLGQRAA